MENNITGADIDAGQPDKSKKLRSTVSVCVRVAVAAAIFLVVLFNYNTLTQLDIRELTAGASSVFVAALIVQGVYLVKSFTFVIPASLVYISVGMAFPAWQAVMINFAGICIEITGTYFLGRFLGGERVEAFIKKKKGGEKLLSFRQKGKYGFVFLLRFSPLPLDFSSLFLGASEFPFPSYFFMSLCGVMPRVAVLTVLGYGIYELIPMKAIITGILCLIPTLLLVWLIKKVCARR